MHSCEKLAKDIFREYDACAKADVTSFLVVMEYARNCSDLALTTKAKRIARKYAVEAFETDDDIRDAITEFSRLSNSPAQATQDRSFMESAWSGIVQYRIDWIDMIDDLYLAVISSDLPDGERDTLVTDPVRSVARSAKQFCRKYCSTVEAMTDFFNEAEMSLLARYSLTREQRSEALDTLCDAINGIHGWTRDCTPLAF